MKYGSKWPEYAKQWDRMTVKPARMADVKRAAARLVSYKPRYESVAELTGVPWWLIAVLHLRESDADFKTYLGNGEPLTRRTRLVPKGRGPFKSWEEGAIDALRYDGLTSIIDFRIEKALWLAERFNGLGYENRGLPSPYVFGGTNIQKPGKYVADGRWSSNVWDQQLGVAPVLAEMAKQDPSIKFVRET